MRPGGAQVADHVSMIFFKSGSSGFGLEDAERLLRERGLQVLREADTLSVHWNAGPTLLVRLSAALYVRDEASEIGEGTPFAVEMSRCDRRFEIGIEDLDAALDEINTLIEVQITLQDATNGYLFNSWNGEVSGPEKAA